MSKNATLEERAVPKHPSLAKVLGYRLNNPSHEPHYIPTLEEAVSAAKQYSAEMQQKAREYMRSSRKY